MSFLTYESARPWAKAIKQAVITKKMPPWFAEAGYVSYRNDPTLTPQEIDILAAWADFGAPEGNAQDKPRSVQWKDGWRIEPDVVVSIPEAYKVPAKGSGEIKVFLVPNPFPQDTWVSSIEVRPGNPSVVHHVMVQVPEDIPAPSFSWGAAAAPCFGPPAGQQRDFSEGTPVPLSVPNVPGVLPGLLECWNTNASGKASEKLRNPRGGLRSGCSADGLQSLRFRKVDSRRWQPPH
jgi:hypothetical protein